MSQSTINQHIGDQHETPAAFRYFCSNCPAGNVRSFESIRGMKIHNTRQHPNSPPLVYNSLSDATPATENVTETDFQHLFHLKSTVGVLKRIPKGARSLAAKTFAQLIKNCISVNDLASWLHLEQFAYKAFQIPKRSRDDESKSLVALVKKNVASMRLPNDSGTFNSADFYKRVESKISDFDIRGAVRLLSSDDSFAPDNEETLNALREKHPLSTRSSHMPPKPKVSDEHYQVTPDQVKHAIMRSHNGSAPGPDGFQPQFFKDLISISAGNAGSTVLTAITDLVNFMLRGEVNEVVCKYLYGASLCALTKKQGGIRPIAVGLSIRRLVSHLACAHAKEVLDEYFKKQFGFGTKYGCEAVVHAVRAFTTDPANIDKVSLKIDYEIAYNSLDRENMLHEVMTQIPSLYKFFWQCYAEPTVLSYNSNTISSEKGAQQGDPSAAFLFPLAIQPIINQMNSELNVWYQDDGTLSDFPSSVLNDFLHLIELSNSIGLKVNSAKCELFFHSGLVDYDVARQFDSVAPGIRIVTAQHFNLLGAPIMDCGFDHMAAQIMQRVEIMFHRLENLRAHSSFFLIKNCFYFETFDNLLKYTLEKILNIDLKGNTWIQASLPTSNRGLGIRQIKDIALPAFLSSAYGASKIVSQVLNHSDAFFNSNIREALDSWSALTNQFPIERHHQKNWDCLNVSRIIKDNLNFSSLQDKARLLALQCNESNAWVNVLPSKNIGTALDNNTIRICIALRLGAPICRPHICSCGTYVNEYGTHGLSCQRSCGRNPRHSEINNILCQALASINVPSTLEPPGLCRDDGKAPDGLTLIPWSHGRHLGWDATCWDTLAPSRSRMASKRARSTAEMASRFKRNKYRELEANNYIVNGFAVETLGPWSMEALDLVSKIGHRLNIVSGDPRSHQFLIQRISLAIQRLNASDIMGTIPHTTRLDEVFYL